MIIIITMINKRNEDNKDFRKIVFLKIIIMIITDFFFNNKDKCSDADSGREDIMIRQTLSLCASVIRRSWSGSSATQ